MIVKLLTEHHLEILRLKGGCIGLSESTLVTMPHCWKSHVTAQLMPSRSSVMCDKLKYSSQVFKFTYYPDNLNIMSSDKINLINSSTMYSSQVFSLLGIMQGHLKKHRKLNC